MHYRLILLLFFVSAVISCQKDSNDDEPLEPSGLVDNVNDNGTDSQKIRTPC
jgi:hypothetical protein